MGSIPDFIHKGRSLVNEVFIETGTMLGETVARAAAAGFERIYSIEVAERHCAAARARFKLHPHITVLYGGSSKVLQTILDRSRPTTFWLDAHYQGGEPDEMDGIAGQCPVLEELRIIFSAEWATPPIILIDDAHMFMEPVPDGFRADHWPTLPEIVKMFPKGYSIDVSGGIIYALSEGNQMIDDKTEQVTHDASGLMWCPERGYGFYPVVQDGQYDKDYWQLYQGYKSSPIAEKLMRARVELVERHAPGATLVDIGIGNGQFIEARHDTPWIAENKGNGRIVRPTFGYDVNPIAVAWLKERALWLDPWVRGCEAAVFWDSLEHIPTPVAFVSLVRCWLFVSIPIFEGLEHILRSKHFKPKEHYHYFTRDGFVRWATQRGFNLVEENRMETELGREGIGTFVLRRMGA